MAESDITPFVSESQIRRFKPLVASAAVPSNGEGGLAIMAGTAGLPIFHPVHGDPLPSDADDFAVVAAHALVANLCSVDIMAEDRLWGPLPSIIYILDLAPVAADAIFFRRDAEGPDACMTGAARFCLFHFGHGEVPGIFYIENCIMTNPAVVVVFVKMYVVAEDHRIGMFELEKDILGFFRCRIRK